MKFQRYGVVLGFGTEIRTQCDMFRLKMRNSTYESSHLLSTFLVSACQQMDISTREQYGTETEIIRNLDSRI